MQYLLDSCSSTTSATRNSAPPGCLGCYEGSTSSPDDDPLPPSKFTTSSTKRSVLTGGLYRPFALPPVESDAVMPAPESVQHCVGTETPDHLYANRPCISSAPTHEDTNQEIDLLRGLPRMRPIISTCLSCYFFRRLSNDETLDKADFLSASRILQQEAAPRRHRSQA